MIKNWKIFNNNLIHLLSEQEMLFYAQRQDWWSWWKNYHLKEPDLEIDNLTERIEENRQAIMYTIDVLLADTVEPTEEELTEEQIELLFSA